MTMMMTIREAIIQKKCRNYGHFPYGGGWAQLHSTAFGGVFPNITEPILDDESSKKCQNLPPKSGHFTKERYVNGP